MGIVVSSHVQTSEFSLATGVIGLVSFGFTLGTFLKVIWVNIDTLGEAPHEVHTYLTTLRTELLEEQANLRGMRKEIRSHRRMCRREGIPDSFGRELDDVSLRTMNDTVKSMIKRFRNLERPYLEKGERGIGDAANHRSRARRRNSSTSPPHYAHAAYSSPPEKNRVGRAQEKDAIDEEAEEEAYWAQRTQYAKFSLGRRMKWLTRKAEAQSLYEDLSRVQIRRIALQVGGMALMMHEYGARTVEMHDQVRRIDERVSRVVGVRRVD